MQQISDEEIENQMRKAWNNASGNKIWTDTLAVARKHLAPTGAIYTQADMDAKLREALGPLSDEEWGITLRPDASWRDLSDKIMVLRLSKFLPPPPDPRREALRKLGYNHAQIDQILDALKEANHVDPA